MTCDGYTIQNLYKTIKNYLYLTFLHTACADVVPRCRNIRKFDAGHELCLLGAVVGCCGGCRNMNGMGTIKGGTHTVKSIAKRISRRRLKLCRISYCSPCETNSRFFTLVWFYT
jgi:hypothetical protein